MPDRRHTAPRYELEDRPLKHLRNGMRRNGDGIWYCCRCHNEILLRLDDRGDHPFGQLVCACGHIICAECTATDILQPLADKDISPVDLNHPDEYGRVCKCGIT